MARVAAGAAGMAGVAAGAGMGQRIAWPVFAWRLLRVAAHILVGLWLCGCLFPRRDAAGRAYHVRRWSARLVGICGVRVELHAAVPTRPAPADGMPMLVANHISWLDVFVLNAIEPCRFVAKAEIRAWPILGWFSEKAGTTFIARGKRGDLRKIFEDLVQRAHQGERVAFFPEGTTAVQGAPLPFHANLFEAAIDAGVPIQPYALRYVDAGGAYHPAAEFVGDTTFLASLMAILHSADLRVQVVRLARLPSTDVPRRALALAAERAVAQALDSAPTAGTLEKI